MSNELLFTVRNFLYRVTFGYSGQSFLRTSKNRSYFFFKKIFCTDRTDRHFKREGERET